MTIIFDLPLAHRELSKFRGAVIKCAGKEKTLFHNHIESGFAYRYPMIQYRIIGGNAALVCINEGIEQAQTLFARGFVGNTIEIGDYMHEVKINSIRQNEIALRVMDDIHKYRIVRWLPLNQHNYKAWRELDKVQRIEQLNKMLVGNILSFAKGTQWQIDSKIKCSIDPDSIITRHIQYKDQQLIAFNAEFSTNVLLPKGIGLGKSVSLGNGVVLRTLQREDIIEKE